MEPNQNTPPQEQEGINPNWSLDRIEAFKRGEQVKAPEENKEDRHVAAAFIRNIAPYVEGRENQFRTETFGALSRAEKTSIYKEIQATIIDLNLAKEEDVLERLKGKISLTGEPGVSYENGELKIGPGATKEDILNLIQKKPKIKPEPTQEVPAVSDLQSVEQEEQKFKIEEIDQLDPNVKRDDYIELGDEKGEGEDEESEEEQEPEPALVTQPPSAEVVASEEENVPEWKKTEEWKNFEAIRKDLAKTEAKKNNYSEDTGKNIEELKAQYIREKEKIAELIRKDEHDILLGLAEGPLTKKQESELNDRLFEELVKRENDVYLDSIRANRKETLKDKTIEKAKDLLGTKAVKWYLSLSRKERIALSFGVGGIAGLAFGATVAPGMVGALSYLGWRAARFGLSGAAGTVAGKWANKKWSAEELQKAEQKETEDLKNANLSLEEKSKGLLDIEKRYKKERLKMTLKKVGTTVAAGAGIGFLTGLAEHAVVDFENKLPPRRGFEPPHAPKPPGVPTQEELNTINAKIYTENSPIEPVVTEESSEIEVSQDVKDLPNKPESLGSTAPEAPVVETEKIFENPEVLVQEAKAGESVWSMLHKTLDDNVRFKNLGGTGTPQEIADQIEAKQTRVLQSFTNEVLKNHDEYGVGPNGEIQIGEKIDFSKLFSDSKKFDEILSDAENLKPTQVSSIIENNEKIEAWIEANPGKKINVDEILSSKPKAEISTEPIMPKPVKLPPIESLGIEVPEEPEVPETLETPTTPKPEEIMPEPSHLPVNEQQIHEEIAEAKRRLEVLEGGKKMRTMMGDVSVAGEVEQAFRNGINDIYSRSGFMGIGKIAGIDTKEWGEVARLPATRVVEYYTGDSTKSGLASDVVEKLSKSSRHNAMASEMVGLMEQSNGAVKPFENENLEQFIKRLVDRVMKVPLQKAA